MSTPIIELQKIDCNCNDCIFMQRDLERFKKSLETHHRWQLDYFNTQKENLYKKADEWKKRSMSTTGDKAKEFKEKQLAVIKEAEKMRFQFNKKEATINYGHCTKLDKPVSFIPNVCQLETQDCFKHRRL